MSKDVTLAELTAIVRKSFAAYDAQGTKHWTWETALKDLSYQVGSLNKVALQLSGERYTEDKSKKQLEWQFTNELADILAEVLYIASELDINMNQAIHDMVKDDQVKIKKRT